MTGYLLDACALIAFFNKEEGADVVESLFENEAEIFVSIVNVYGKGARQEWHRKRMNILNL